MKNELHNARYLRLGGVAARGAGVLPHAVLLLVVVVVVLTLFPPPLDVVVAVASLDSVLFMAASTNHNNNKNVRYSSRWQTTTRCLSLLDSFFTRAHEQDRKERKSRTPLESTRLDDLSAFVG